MELVLEADLMMVRDDDDNILSVLAYVVTVCFGWICVLCFV